MTTIAYDGRTLAADTQSSMMRGKALKAFRLEDGTLFGACGEAQDAIAVRDWLEDGGEKPKVQDTFHAIVIKDGELYTLENKLVLMLQCRPFFAIGSGRDFAMAAMHLGKTAVEAIGISHQFDVDTGSEVTALAVDETHGTALLFGAVAEKKLNIVR